MSASKAHIYTQFLGPIGIGAAYHFLLRPTIFNSFYRKSPRLGHLGIYNEKLFSWSRIFRYFDYSLVKLKSILRKKIVNAT